MSEKIIVVGGVAGGATALARLRRLDEEAQLLLLERWGICILCQLRPALLYRRKHCQQRGFICIEHCFHRREISCGDSEFFRSH